MSNEKVKTEIDDLMDVLQVTDRRLKTGDTPATEAQFYENIDRVLELAFDRSYVQFDRLFIKRETPDMFKCYIDGNYTYDTGAMKLIANDLLRISEELEKRLPENTAEDQETAADTNKTKVQDGEIYFYIDPIFGAVNSKVYYSFNEHAIQCMALDNFFMTTEEARDNKERVMQKFRDGKKRY